MTPLHTTLGKEPCLRSWMALRATKHLKYARISGAVVFTGKRVNSVAGYGVELPWQYTIQGGDFSLVSACYIIMYVEWHFGTPLKCFNLFLTIHVSISLAHISICANAPNFPSTVHSKARYNCESFA